MSNKQLADNFASGATEDKGSNMFIDGDTIYSYGRHFPIARRMPDGTINFTTRKYSQSTTIQTSKVRSSLDAAGLHDKLVFTDKV